MSGPIGSFSGLASGIQWRDMIDQIISVEARPINALRQQVTRAEQRSRAWTDFTARVRGLADAARALAEGRPLQAHRAGISGVPPGVQSPLSVSVGEGAQPGSHNVAVQRLASHEKLGSDLFASRTAALDVEGEFLLNGRRISVTAGDSLEAVARRINEANTGPKSTGVSAAIVTATGGAQRLVLTSASSGAKGIDLVDGASGALRSLGFLDAHVSTKHALSNGVAGDVVDDTTTALATLRGLATSPAATLNIGGLAVAVDLKVDSLTDIAQRINDAAQLAGRGVTAQVVAVSGGHRLEIRGTTDVAQQDVAARNAAEVLGIVAGGRTAVAHSIQGSALTTGQPPAAATTATLWTDVLTPSAAAVLATDTVQIAGTIGSASFNFTHALDGSIGALIDRLNGAEGFNGSATASMGSDGRIVVTDNAAGESRLSLAITARNESGAALDLGNFDVVQAGRVREITRGADAEILVDGARITSSSNTVTDAVAGVTLRLTTASATTVTVQVTRDDDAAVQAFNQFIDAYNALDEFVATQLRVPAPGGKGAALYGSSTLRGMRGLLRQAMGTEVAADLVGLHGRLSAVGSEIGADGRFTKDATKLRAALAADPQAVQRLLGQFTATSTSSLHFIGATAATTGGNYAVNVTKAPTTASVTGTAFSGTYTGAGEGDALVIRLVGSSATHRVELTDGMSLDDVVDALNSSFSASPLRASVDAGRLRIEHAEVGGAAGFEIAFEGSAATSQVGLEAGTHRGTDIEGTIGGHAATGAGRVLTGASATPVAGLAVMLDASATGAAGSVTFSRGVATAVELAAKALLDAGAGSIRDVTEQQDSAVRRGNERIDQLQARLDRRREQLILRFTAMERSLSKAQSQSAWLTSQIAQFDAAKR